MSALTPTSSHHRPLLGMTLGALAYFCYTVQDTLVSLMTKIYPPVQVAWMDCVVALTALVGVIAWRKGGKSLKLLFHTKQPRVHMLRGTLFAVGTALVFTGVAHVPLPHMYVIIFLSPLLGAALSGVFLKEPAGKRIFALLLLGFAGVVTAIRPGAEGFSIYSLFILGAACMFAVNAILNRYLARKDNASPLIAYPLAAVVVIMAVPTFMNFKMIALQHVIPFLLIGIFLATALSLSARAFKYAPIYLIAPCQLLQFLWGTLAQLFVYGNWPTEHTLMGAAMIVTANLLILYLQYRAHRQPAVVDPLP